MDLIKRSDAIKAIDDLPHCYNGWSDAYDKAYIIGTLEDPTIVPSVEPNEIYDYVFKAGYDKGVKDAITSTLKGMTEHIGISIKRAERESE